MTLKDISDELYHAQLRLEHILISIEKDSDHNRPVSTEDYKNLQALSKLLKECTETIDLNIIGL